VQDVAQCLRRFEPPAPIQIERVALPTSDHEVLVLQADAAYETRPFAFDGRSYERVGSTTSVMPQATYQRLLLERAHAKQRWENLSTAVSLEDLEQGEILRTLRLGAAAGRMPASVSADSADVLDRLGLRVRGQVLNAAVVVFGRRMLPDYPQCQLRMARFRGNDKTEFLDQRQVHGHALQLLEDAMQFLTRHLPVAGRIEPGVFERADSPLFPPIALREALVNAFCHRDYSITGSAVSLAIYDDRLEIWSDGTLPFGLSIDDLKRDHPSRPRNPLIAEAFYRRGLVERWGRGTQKIVELCVQAGHPEPEFIEQAGALGARRSLFAQCVYRTAPRWPRPHDAPTPDLAGVSGQAGRDICGTAIIGRSHGGDPNVPGRSPALKEAGDDRITRPGARRHVVHRANAQRRQE